MMQIISDKKSRLRHWTIAAGQMLTVVIALLSSSTVIAAALPPVDDIVVRLQSMYDNTQDLTAHFTQESTVTSIRKTDVEEGIVYFKNPRQMLWDYTRPKAKKLIINAQSAWLYLPEEKIAYTQEPEVLFQSAALIKFLSGIGQLSDDFTISYASPNASDLEGNYLLILHPKEKNASYQYLRMTVDKNKYHILRVSFDDVLGNNTVLKFNRIRLNTKISNKIFQFQPPADVNVFKMP
ncbi:MAG: outer membrane lipoprotein carrier protein LolA [Smithellaceae bacterium]